MNPELSPNPNPPLTPEQEDIANLLIEQCGLQEYADNSLEMMGSSGTVTYGLGRCAEHLMDHTPDEIKDMILKMLEQQSQQG